MSFPDKNSVKIQKSKESINSETKLKRKSKEDIASPIPNSRMTIEIKQQELIKGIYYEKNNSNKHKNGKDTLWINPKAKIKESRSTERLNQLNEILGDKKIKDRSTSLNVDSEESKSLLINSKFQKIKETFEKFKQNNKLIYSNESHANKNPVLYKSEQGSANKNHQSYAVGVLATVWRVYLKRILRQSYRILKTQ